MKRLLDLKATALTWTAILAFLGYLLISETNPLTLHFDIKSILSFLLMGLACVGAYHLKILVSSDRSLRNENIFTKDSDDE